MILKTRWSRVAWRGDWLFHTLLNSLNWRTDLHCSFMALSQVHFSFSPRFFFLSQRSYPSIHGHISTQQVETTFKDSKHLSHLLVNGEHFYSPFFLVLWASKAIYDVTLHSHLFPHPLIHRWWRLPCKSPTCPRGSSLGLSVSLKDTLITLNLKVST